MLFFSLVLFSGPLEPGLAAMGLTPLYAAVLVGAAQNIFSKSSKYSLFDPCKEMAYIPLDQETKVRGTGCQGMVLRSFHRLSGPLLRSCHGIVTVLSWLVAAFSSSLCKRSEVIAIGMLSSAHPFSKPPCRPRARPPLM